MAEEGLGGGEVGIFSGEEVVCTLTSLLGFVL